MITNRQLHLAAPVALYFSMCAQVGMGQDGYTSLSDRLLDEASQSRHAAAPQNGLYVADKGPRIGGILVPPAGVVGAFNRAADLQHTQVCDTLSAVLTRLTPILRSSIERQNQSECTIEVEPVQGEAAPNESLFIQVRAEADLISSLRFKLVTVQTSKPNKMAAWLVEIAVSFFEALRWSDLADLAPRVQALVPFELTRYGIRIRMIKEETSSGAYDLFVTPVLPASDQAQTSAFTQQKD